MTFLDSVLVSDAVGWPLPCMRHQRTLGEHARAALEEMQRLLKLQAHGSPMPYRSGGRLVLPATPRRLTKQYVRGEYLLNPYKHGDKGWVAYKVYLDAVHIAICGQLEVLTEALTLGNANRKRAHAEWKALLTHFGYLEGA